VNRAPPNPRAPWALAGALLSLTLAGASHARADDAAPQDLALHVQATVVDQGHLAFDAPYSGPQSLSPDANGRETFDATAYLGARLWRGAEAWIDPEVDQGFGLNNTLGLAGFPSAEAYKVGSSSPYFRLQRAFVRQTLDLGGGVSKVDPDLNVLGGSRSDNRIVITVGKLSVTDIFDNNDFAHDPRHDFLNWTIVDAGSFDYAADAWGFTFGAAAEWYQGDWTLRGGLYDLSKRPNSSNVDYSFGQFQVIGELERRFDIFGRKGALRVTGFATRGRMGKYDAAVLLAEETGQAADTGLVRRYRTRPGVSLTFEQALSESLGLFVRAGHAEGSYEGFDFTDISNTLAAGLALKGSLWGRKDDVVGVAGVDSQASRAALAYFAAGGVGILAGDGELPHPGAEKVLETYYTLPFVKVTRLTFDYQFVDNPAFNRDRGPVSIFAFRIHAQL